MATGAVSNLSPSSSAGSIDEMDVQGQTSAPASPTGTASDKGSVTSVKSEKAEEKSCFGKMMDSVTGFFKSLWDSIMGLFCCCKKKEDAESTEGKDKKEDAPAEEAKAS